MTIWFFIVMVIGIGYALNRLTSTTDLPVSTRLAQAREIVEQGRRRRAVVQTVTTPLAARPATTAAEQQLDRRAA